MRYFWGLDVLRFIAASLVVLFHFSTFGTEFLTLDPGNGPLGWLQPVGWFGWIGVQIFFVISGFIISASAENSNAVTFLQKRAIRVLPVLWLSTMAAFAVRMAMGEEFTALLPVFIKTMLLSPKGPYMDGVVWTLVVEAIFYLAVATVMVLFKRLQDTPRALQYLALALGIASTAFNACHFLAIQTELLPLAIDFRWFGFDVALLRHGVFFAVGILLYLQYSQKLSKVMTFALACFVPGCMMQIPQLVPPGENALWPIGIWAMASLATYLGALYGDRIFNSNVRAITRPLGLMTYPLYLNHYILGQALLPLVSSWIAGPVALFVAMSAVLLLNAWLIATIPEPWMQNYGRKLMSRQLTSQLSRS